MSTGLSTQLFADQRHTPNGSEDLGVTEHFNDPNWDWKCHPLPPHVSVTPLNLDQAGEGAGPDGQSASNSSSELKDTK